MNQTAEAQKGQETREVSKNKFHPIFEQELAVALETTFHPQEELVWDSALYNPGLVHRSVHFQRVYSAAIVTGNVSSDSRAEVTFIAPVEEVDIKFREAGDGSELPYHRLVFRRRFIKNQGGRYRWLMFGRHGEQKPFGFFKDFIPLDFFGKMAGEFVPLYVKARKEESREGRVENFVYFIIEGQIEDGGPKLNIRRVEAEEAPSHLVEAI